MPFGFGRKKDAPVEAESGSGPEDARGQSPRDVRFHGLTEEWQLQGTMAITGRSVQEASFLAVFIAEEFGVAGESLKIAASRRRK